VKTFSVLIYICIRLDTGVYDEPLDDFGNNADDFM
jgi:hypothetical protein